MEPKNTFKMFYKYAFIIKIRFNHLNDNYIINVSK